MTFYSWAGNCLARRSRGLDVGERAGQLVREANPQHEDQRLAKHPARRTTDRDNDGKLVQLEMDDDALDEVLPHLLARTR